MMSNFNRLFALDDMDAAPFPYKQDGISIYYELNNDGNIKTWFLIDESQEEEMRSMGLFDIFAESFLDMLFTVKDFSFLYQKGIVNFHNVTWYLDAEWDEYTYTNWYYPSWNFNDISQLNFWGGMESE